MRVKLTYMWGDWFSYYANSPAECKDNTDRFAYKELVRSGGLCVQVGRVCAERAPSVPEE